MLRAEMQILAVEDEEHLQKLLKAQFDFERWEVTFCEKAEEALALLLDRSFDVVVLDWMLKGPMTGLEFCKKASRAIPILMLTARSSPVDIVLALESGADDFITKPFDGAVLIARIRALKRRTQIKKEPKSDCIQIGALQIYPDCYEVKNSGSKIDLTISEFKLLLAIIDARGSVLSRSALLKTIQEKGVTVVERIVDTHVYSIRKKLGKAGDFIETIRGIGYRIKP